MARETTSLPRPIVICGAGLAGLSLACALLEAGEQREVVLLDPRTGFGRDRTWCWWAAAPSRFDAAISARWRAWEVVAPGGRRASHTDARIPYVHARADAVYALALERLAGEQVTLRLGTRVEALDLDAPAAVLADGERVDASWLVDARGRSPGGAGTAGGAHAADGVGAGTGPGRGGPHGARGRQRVALVQAFLGLEVRTDRPVFTPGRVTLMDFAGAEAAPEGGLRFVYVLPFAPDRALVEDTTFGPADAPGIDARRAALGRWLAARGAAFEVLHEEQGRLPMTDARPPLVLADRVVAAGTGAGAVRPSSGYAFARTQAHATALAQAIVADGSPPARLAPRRTERLDAVLLRALRDEPQRFPALFAALVAGTTSDAFARFMADAATPADEAQLVVAGADRALVRASLRHLTRR